MRDISQFIESEKKDFIAANNFEYDLAKFKRSNGIVSFDFTTLVNMTRFLIRSFCCGI